MNDNKKISEHINSELNNYPGDQFFDGGDLFVVNQELKAFSTTSGCNKWRWYVRFREYWKNVVEVEGDDEFKRLFPYLMTMKIDYGKIGVMKIDGRFVLVGVNNIKPDGIFGWKGEGYAVNCAFNYYGSGFVNFNQDQRKFTINDTNCVIFKDNIHNLPGYWYLSDILDDFLTMKSAVNTNMNFMAKKVAYNVNNNSSEVIKEEVKSILDTRHPFVVNIKNQDDTTGMSTSFDRSKDMGIANKLEVLALPDNNIENDINAIEKYLNLIFSLIGRSSNFIDKKERVISDEVERNNSAVEIVAKGFMDFIEQGIDEVNKMWGLNIKIVKNLASSDDEDEEKEMENDPNK